MKSKIKYILMVLFPIFLLNNIDAQSYIGNYEVYESSGDYYLETGTNDVRINENVIIIEYQTGTLKSTIQSFEQTKNLQLKSVANNYYIYYLPNNINYITYCQDIEQSTIVDYIEVSVYFTFSNGFDPDDEDIDEQYYLDLLDVFDAWGITTGDNDVIVGVLDTGLEFNNEEFGPNVTNVSNLFMNSNDPWTVWDNPNSGDDDDNDINGYEDDYIGWNFYDMDNDVTPGGNLLHGSLVSGIIAEKTNNGVEHAGIAGGNCANNLPGVRILPLKSGEYNLVNGSPVTTGLSSDIIIEAINYAVDMGADIINMSFDINGGNIPPSIFTAIHNTIINAYNNGVLLVGSAGNHGDPYSVSYPARWDEVIAVGATNESDNAWIYSDEGDGLELMAPGVDISIYGVSGIDGTSLSAPMVTATAALMLSVNPSLTIPEIREILRLTAYKNVSSQHPFNQTMTILNETFTEWDPHFGFGRINTLDAVCMALEYKGDLTVNTSENWNTPQFSKNDIYIENGTTVTLTSTLMMDPSAKIIVKPGGKFIVDGGTITNMPYCSGDNLKWGGIEVWGNPSASQQADANGNYLQGYLEIKNGATIKNAQTAVALRKAGTWDQYGGGIVKAYNSNFINNAKSVWFAPYQNNVTIGIYTFEDDNEAYFRNCVFEINNEYFDDSEFHKHADIVQVKGVEFRGCDFTRLSNDNTSEYCAGIDAFSAGIKVNSYNSDPCTFYGLYKGIKQSENSITTTYASYIQNSEFTNNSIGIELNSMNSIVTIKDNTFNVGYNAPDKTICSSSQSYGIFLNNSNTFVIQDNEFYKYSSAPSNGDYIGIEAFNTESSSDEIFRNTYSGLNFANHTTDKNCGVDEQEGLAFYCNINSNNNNDLFFTFVYYPGSGVQTGQGNENRSAGNVFSQNMGVNEFNIYNDAENGIGYYYNVNEPLEIPTAYNQGNGYVTPHPQTLAADCSGGGISPKELSESEKSSLESEYLAAEADYQNVTSLYESLLDGGSTEELQTEVNTTWPDDMWELRAELLGLSPYLSKEVLITAADKTDVLPESVLFEILSANPEELKKEELMSYLENKEQPLPEYMIEILRQLAAGQSAKTVLLNQKAHYHREKSRAALEMLACLPFDEIFNYDNYRFWLNKLGGLNSDRKIVSSFVEEGNYSDALALANMFPDLYALENDALNEHNYYMEMLNLDITLKQENRSPLQLNGNEYSMLENLAENSKSIAGVQAKGILEYFYGQHFCNCVKTSTDENKSSTTSFNPNQFAEAMGLKINADPNPASTWVTFNYQLPIGKEKAFLIIKNTEGKQVTQFVFSNETGQQVWDTRSFKSGNYIYEFSCDKLKQSGKIVIIH